MCSVKDLQKRFSFSVEGSYSKKKFFVSFLNGLSAYFLLPNDIQLRRLHVPLITFRLCCFSGELISCFDSIVIITISHQSGLQHLHASICNCPTHGLWLWLCNWLCRVLHCVSVSVLSVGSLRWFYIYFCAKACIVSHGIVYPYHA